MLPFLWSTDIHLDHAGDEAAQEFVEEVRQTPGAAWLITGDITSFQRLERHLKLLAACGKDVYFVLGNHDAYGGSTPEAEAVAKTTAEDVSNLHYLPTTNPASFGDAVLVGVDGYADGRAGSLFSSGVWLNDYLHNRTFNGVGYNRALVKPILRRLGDESASQLRRKLEAALALGPKTVFIATHPPPFVEAHWHGGKATNDPNWMPHFVNVVFGEMVREFAATAPAVDFVVLAGHTHGACNVKIADNIRCLVGGAEYCAPALVDVTALPGS